MCPINIDYGIFVNETLDNIDHDLSSSTAKLTIPWDEIFMFQHPDTTTDERKK